MTPPNNTIDKHLNKLIGHDDVEFGDGYHDDCKLEVEEAKQALKQALLRKAETYTERTISGDEYFSHTAVPVEAIEELFKEGN